MSQDREWVEQRFAALQDEAQARGIPASQLGSLLLDAIIAAWRGCRRTEDIASELEFAAANLDPEREYTFIRP